MKKIILILPIVLSLSACLTPLKKAEGNKNLQTDTYQALDYLFEMGDPLRLNTVLTKYKDNPNMSGRFDNIIRYDRINEEDLEKGNLANYLRSENNHDAALGSQLDTNGDGVVDKKDLKGLRKRFVKRITKDGKVEILDTHTLAGANGYFKNWNPANSPQNNTKSKDEWQFDKFKSLQAELSNATDDNEKQMIQEQIDFLKSSGKGGKGYKPSTDQVKAGELADAEQTIQDLGSQENLSLEDTKKLNEAKKRVSQGMTTEGKNNQAKQKAAFDLDSKYKDFNAEELRQAIDTNLEDKVKFGRLTNFTTQEKKELYEILPQVQAMKKASELGANEAGIWDTTIRDLENQFTGIGYKDVQGQLTVSAYQGLMTVLRHAMIGSAQTESEMKSYKSAYSSLDQGLVPALAGLRTVIDGRLQELRIVASFKNSTVAKYYTGQSSEELDKIIATLDNKLNYLGEFARYADTYAKAQGRDLVDKVRGFIGSVVGVVSEDADNFISGVTDDDVKAARAKLKQAYANDDFQAKKLELLKKYGLPTNEKPVNPLDVEL